MAAPTRMMVGLVLALGLSGPWVLLLIDVFGLADVPVSVAVATVLLGSVSLLGLLGRSRRRLAILSDAIDATNCSIGIYDAADRLVLANRRYRDVLDLPPEEFFTGVTYQDLVRRSLEKHLPPEAIEEELSHRVAIHRRADGRPADRQYPNNRWERVTKTRLPSGINVGIAMDVTEYYALKEQLDIEARRFSALARGAPVGICLVDGRSNISFVNDALLAMTGAGDRRALLETPQTFWIERQEVPTFERLIEVLRHDTAETEVRLDLHGETHHLMVRKAFVPITGEQVSAEAGSPAENLLIFVDITTRKAAEARVSYLALHDPLTGAFNRVAFAEDLESASAGADMKRPAALIAIDLARFKPVNDVHGHAAGDALLCRVVDRIGASIPPECRLYRIGGDEFAVLCPPPVGANALAYSREILERLCEPFDIEGERVLIGASIGTSALPLDTDNPQTLVHYADLALYQGKSRGGGSVHAFSPAVLSSADTRRIMELDLAEAIEHGDITIVMQPIFGADRVRPMAAEALARWTNRRTGEIVPPSTFIPIAESTSLIVRLDLFIFRKAITTYARLLKDGAELDRLMINVSVRTLEQTDFVAEVRSMLEATGVPGESIVFEVTENFLVHDVHRLATTMQTISASGVRFALDDFGAGYTSLRMLADLPVSYLKIDQCFVRDLSNPDMDRPHQIIRAMVELAAHLDLEVIAEGVEDEETYARLESLGCTLFQGFLLGAPRRPETFARAGKDTAAA